MSKNTLAIKVNGKTVKGSAQNIVGRVVEAEMGASFREEALKAQAVAAYTYIRYNNQKGTIHPCRQRAAFLPRSRMRSSR